MASSSPARMRSRPSPLLARWVMSVLRMTGQRPESGAGSATPAASAGRLLDGRGRSAPPAGAGSCRSPGSSGSSRGRPPRPPSRSSSTEKPWLPMETTVAGAVAAAGSGSRRPAPAWRGPAAARPGGRAGRSPPRRPRSSQSQPARSAASARPGSFWCSTAARRVQRSPPRVGGELDHLDRLRADVDADETCHGASRPTRVDPRRRPAGSSRDHRGGWRATASRRRPEVDGPGAW